MGNDLIALLKSKKTSNNSSFSTGKNVATSGQIKKVEENYMSGHCMFLAIALKERFGYRIDMNTGVFGKDAVIEHAWVAVSDNQGFDVCGYFDTNNPNMEGKRSSDVSKEEIFHFMVKSDIYQPMSEHIFNQKVKSAHKLINNYIIYKHPELSPQ